MSKHKHSNYSNMYQTNHDEVKMEVEVAETETVVEPVVDVVVTETVVEPVIEVVETDVPSISTIGTVVDCSKLNIRETPSLKAKIMTVITVGDKVKIIETGSDFEWYHVITSTGVEGFTRREFVKA